MKKGFGILIIFLLFLFVSSKTYAQSNYVLPYPSSMPGSLLYKIHLIYEGVSKYWYFGDFGQFDYNLKMADKYLVEAKTLFEYKQYLLGYKSLQKSDLYFLSISQNLEKAGNNRKNIVQKKMVLGNAAQKHIETLEKMKAGSPDTFNWQPEKALPTMLDIKRTIENSINVRKNDL